MIKVNTETKEKRSIRENCFTGHYGKELAALKVKVKCNVWGLNTETHTQCLSEKLNIQWISRAEN